MKNILEELIEKENIRTNLSSLRLHAKDEDKRAELCSFFDVHEGLIQEFFADEDAKVRKNISLLLGDIGKKDCEQLLLDGYRNEKTLFVKSSYLQALGKMNVEMLLPELKKELDKVLAIEVTEENQKHINEEIKELRNILVKYEGINHHTVDVDNKKLKVLLLTNRNLREIVRRMITCGDAQVHPLGVLVETSNLRQLMKLRTYREMLFLLDVEGFVSSDPIEAAQEIWDGGFYELLQMLHKEAGEFYYRIECKSAMELEKRSLFTKKLGASLDRISEHKLVNSTGDYEVELRMIANKEGKYLPCVKLYNLHNPRFDYRKNAIATSIHPSTAALIMEVAAPYLKEGAQIMDPFCGVGTMLVERHKRVSAKEIYGTDIYGEAIKLGRENAQLAGVKINLINRDFMEFEHSYPFDEIVTNMPLRGKKTKQEMDAFYGNFFKKMKEILGPEAVIIMYTNEMGFVKKQMRLHKEYELLQQTCMQTKNDFNLVIMKYKR